MEAWRSDDMPMQPSRDVEDETASRRSAVPANRDCSNCPVRRGRLLTALAGFAAVLAAAATAVAVTGSAGIGDPLFPRRATAAMTSPLRRAAAIRHPRPRSGRQLDGSASRSAATAGEVLDSFNLDLRLEVDRVLVDGARPASIARTGS